MEVNVVDYSGSDCSLGVTVGPGNVLFRASCRLGLPNLMPTSIAINNIEESSLRDSPDSLSIELRRHSPAVANYRAITH